MNNCFVQTSADHIHPDPPPQIPEGGRPRNHQGGDPQGGDDGGHGRDRPRRDGAKERPDPVVQRSEPHPDTGTTSAPHTAHLSPAPNVLEAVTMVTREAFCC